MQSTFTCQSTFPWGVLPAQDISTVPQHICFKVALTSLVLSSPFTKSWVCLSPALCTTSYHTTQGNGGCTCGSRTRGDSQREGGTTTNIQKAFNMKKRRPKGVYKAVSHKHDITYVCVCMYVCIHNLFVSLISNPNLSM